MRGGPMRHLTHLEVLSWRLSLVLLLLPGVLACKRHSPAPEAKKEAQKTDKAEKSEKGAVTDGPAVTAKAESARILRPALLAGSWYEADPKALGAALDSWLGAAHADARPPKGALLGIVAPHAGYRFSGRTAASVYRLVREAKPRRVFVLGTSHHERIRGVAVLNASHYGTPLGELTVDRGAGEALMAHPLFFDRPEAHAREHSVEMQMPFLRRVAPQASVVPLVVGALTLPEVHQVAAHIRAQLRPGDLVVASSDFTHQGPRYGYVPFQMQVREQLKALDMRARNHIESGDIPAFWRFKHGTSNTICGFYPISVLMALFGGQGRAGMTYYTTSGHDSGDFSNTVSYLGIAFSQSEGTARGSAKAAGGAVASFLSADDQRRALQIARRTIAHHLKTGGERFDPAAAGLVGQGRLGEVHGLFVTLKNKRDDSLRGCIGSIVGREPLHKGIARHALNAAFRDRRFQPLRAEELTEIAMEVTVLTPPRPVADHNAITIGLDGVILQRDGHSAVFLPQVAVEQGWGLEQTLSALSRKAGLGLDGWRGAGFQTFQGHVYDERHLGLLTEH